MKILKFNYNGKEIDFSYQNKKLAYVYEDDGRYIQNGINLPSRKSEDVIGASITLFINALESIEQYENSRLREGIAGEVPGNSDRSESEQAGTL